MKIYYFNFNNKKILLLNLNNNYINVHRKIKKLHNYMNK